MISAALLSTLFLVLTVSANPIAVRESQAKLPLARRLNVTSVHNLLRHDVARAKFLRASAEAKLSGASDFHTRQVIDEQVDSQAVSYIAPIGVGSPAATYQLLVDTGSSNTWVGATQPYIMTNTSFPTGNNVSVNYGSGSFAGIEFLDTVTIANGFAIPRQSIGDAVTSTGFQGTDGIIGIGPNKLTLGTLTPETNTLIATVTDNAFSSGLISSDQLGISFEPTTSANALNGEISWGGTDRSKFTGNITFTNITKTQPAALFWGIDQNITYGNDEIPILMNGSGVSVFEFTRDAQAWPRTLNTAIGGTADNVYLIVGDIGTDSASGFDFVNGFAFLERFYSVFDTANNRVGFANTSHTMDQVNVMD
ncbi:hypothetical protein C0992_004255 [Termitomyces sp. T32_za158]|nr:hypothetical protein C0992_004255 [Termitomyces sp. T32_za158]